MSWIAAVSSQSLAVKQTFATPHAKMDVKVVLAAIAGTTHWMQTRPECAKAVTSALLQKSDYQRESEQELYNCAMAGKGDEERPTITTEHKQHSGLRSTATELLSKQAGVQSLRSGRCAREHKGCSRHSR